MTGIQPSGIALWLPLPATVFHYLPAALGLFWLLFAYRLYAAHRRDAPRRVPQPAPQLLQLTVGRQSIGAPHLREVGRAAE